MLSILVKYNKRVQYIGQGRVAESDALLVCHYLKVGHMHVAASDDSICIRSLEPHITIYIFLSLSLTSETTPNQRTTVVDADALPFRTGSSAIKIIHGVL